MEKSFIKLSPFLVGLLSFFMVTAWSGGLLLPRTVFADEPAAVAEPFVQAQITEMDPDLIRFSQRTAGAPSEWSKSVFFKMSAQKGERVFGGVVIETVEGGGRVVGVKIAFPTDADALRALFYCKGYDKNFPAVVVELIDPATGKKYYVGFDNTRPAVAQEVGMKKIPVRVYPENMTAPASVQPQRGGRLTWGEVIRLRMQGQTPVFEWYAAHPFGAEELERLAGTPIHPSSPSSTCPPEPPVPPPTPPTPSCPNTGILPIDEELARLGDALKKAQADYAETLAANETYMRNLKDLEAARFGLTDEEFAALRAQLREARKNARQGVQDAEKALAGAKARARAAGCAPPPTPPPPPKPCPPGTTFQGYQTIPEKIDDIMKLYRGKSYDDVLADIDHFLKTGRPDVARRIAQAMQQSLDEEGAALGDILARRAPPSMPDPAWDALYGDDFQRRTLRHNNATDGLRKSSSEISKAKPPVCPTEAELAARAGDSFKKTEGTLRKILQKLKPTEIKEGIQKIKNFFLKVGSWQGIRAQLLSKSNVAFTVIASGIEVYIQAEKIDELLRELENYHEQFDMSIKTIKRAKAELERVRMDPACTVKDPKDPKNLNKLRFAIISEIKNAFVLATALDSANAKLLALHDDAWLGKDWFSPLMGWRSGFGSRTDYTAAVVNLYPELTNETCAEDEVCAPLSLIPICKKDGRGGGGGGAGGGDGSGWDITGEDVCNFPIIKYEDWGERRYDPKGSRPGSVGYCIGAVQCCAMADCAPGPYANVWGMRLRSGRVVKIWGCQGLPRELPPGACRQPEFTSLEINALCNESEQEWSPALRARLAALEQAANIALTGSSSGDAGPATARGGATRSGKPLDFQFSAFSVTNFAARLVVVGLLAGR